MSAILYYITGHGFGHAVRSNLVIRALKRAAPALHVHVRTTAPEWLFHDPAAPIVYSKASIDVGIIQKDSLEMDFAATLRACRNLHDEIPALIGRELKFVKRHGIDLIVGDIPPLGFEIAARASIPSVAITNFTWNWIYRAYVKNHPGFLPLIEEMERFYNQATLALALPYPGEMDVFRKCDAIPWIARTSSLSKQQARVKFALPDSVTIVLLSFGGLGLKDSPWHRLKQMRNYYFVATGDKSERDSNLSIFPDAQLSYQDLVRAADVIITKPGYGIVADVIAHHIPVLHTYRGDFPEYSNLVQALNELATEEFVPQNELMSGDVEPYIARLLAKNQNWPAVALNGAEVAAEKILTLLDAQSR